MQHPMIFLQRIIKNEKNIEIKKEIFIFLVCFYLFFLFNKLKKKITLFK